MYNKYICVNDGRDDMPSTRCYLLPQSLIAFISKLGLQNKQIVTANICSVERVVVGSKSTPPPLDKVPRPWPCFCCPRTEPGNLFWKLAQPVFLSLSDPRGGSWPLPTHVRQQRRGLWPGCGFDRGFWSLRSASSSPYLRQTDKRTTMLNCPFRGRSSACPGMSNWLRPDRNVFQALLVGLFFGPDRLLGSTVQLYNSWQFWRFFLAFSA